MFRAGKNGVSLQVKITPKAARNALIRIDTDAGGGEHLKASVTAVPEKGKANAALIKLLAQKLGLPKSSITLIAGETSRQKTLHIDGAPGELLKILNAKLRALGLMG
jgi:uncharacterized protein (TIGR00251 family)